MEDIILVGGGGHCRSVVDSIIGLGKFNICGIIDLEMNLIKEISGLKVIGTDRDLKKFSSLIKFAFITLGSVGDATNRMRLYHYCKRLGFRIPIIIDNTAIVSTNVDIGSGTYIAKGTIINTGTIIGENTILNTGSIIEHDCQIGNNVHISPRVILGGGVHIDDGSHIGIGTTVIQDIKIGKNVIIGSASNVIRDINDNSKVYGNPCKGVKSS